MGLSDEHILLNSIDNLELNIYEANKILTVH